MIGDPLWNVELGDYVSALAVDASGGLAAAGSLAGDGIVADVATGDVVAKLPEHPFGTSAVAWADGRLATGGQDGVVRVLDAAFTEVSSVAVGGWVQRLAWSPDGHHLAAAAGRHVVVIDRGGAVAHRYPALTSTVTDLAWTDDGRRIGACAYGGIAWFEPQRQESEAARTFEWKGSLLGLAIAPSGRWACAGSQDSSVHLWKLWSGDELSMSGYPAKIERLVFSPESQWLAVGCLGGLTVWDFSGKGPSGRAPASGEEHDRHIDAIVWQRDGGRLVTGCAAGRLALWRRPRKPRELLRPIDTHDGEAGVSALAWPRVDTLVVGRADGTIERRAVGG